MEIKFILSIGLLTCSLEAERPVNLSVVCIPLSA